MKYKTIFFLFLSTFLIGSESIQYLSISEFQKSIENSENKKVFLKFYLEEINELDKETNSIISLYSADKLYKSYVYGKNKDWQGIPILLKDNIDTKGLANTAGSISLIDNFPRNDAQLVRNLKKSG